MHKRSYRDGLPRSGTLALIASIVALIAGASLTGGVLAVFALVLFAIDAHKRRQA